MKEREKEGERKKGREGGGRHSSFLSRSKESDANRNDGLTTMTPSCVQECRERKAAVQAMHSCMHTLHAYSEGWKDGSKGLVVVVVQLRRLCKSNRHTHRRERAARSLDY